MRALDAGATSSCVAGALRPAVPRCRGAAACTAVAARSASCFAGAPALPRVRTSSGRGGQRRSRLDVCAVIPMLQGDSSQQLPPDLPSFLFKERIVYLGMSLVPSVTELILAELLYLQFEDAQKPIYLYINSTGTTKDGKKLGYDTEAFAIYDTLKYVKPPVHTICVGTAFGEAAMLLAAGEQGHRAALPSSTIMIKQNISMFRGQATDLEIARQETRNTKRQYVEILSKCTDKTLEQIEADIARPKYFTPYTAVQYGLIDKVLEADSAKAGKAAALLQKGLSQGR